VGSGTRRSHRTNPAFLPGPRRAGPPVIETAWCGLAGFKARWFGPRIPIPSTRRGSLRAHSSRTPGFLTCGSGSWWDPDVGGTAGCFRCELWVVGGDRIRPWELGFCFARGEEFGIFCGKSCYVASVTRGSL
jgi:hypothetical protein